MATSPFITAANKFEPAIRKALIKAFNSLRTQSSKLKIEQALLTGGLDAVIREFINIDSTLLSELNPILDSSFIAGSNVVFQTIPAAAFITGVSSVSIFNRDAADFLSKYKLNLIKTISDNTREAIRQLLLSDLMEGRNPRDTARDIRNSIGLTPRQEQAVRNYRKYLETLDKQALQRALRDKRSDSPVLRAIKTGQPLSPEKIDKLVNKYRDRYIKYRAEVIARTEALRAVTIGNRAAIETLIKEGEIDVERTRRFWVYVKDKRTRDPHRQTPALNPDGRRLDEPFKTPLGPLLYPRDPNGTAANTVQCRCVERYRILPEGEK